MVKKIAVASSQSHLSKLQVSSLDLKGCGNYGPDNIWKKKKKMNKKPGRRDKMTTECKNPAKRNTTNSN